MRLRSKTSYSVNESKDAQTSYESVLKNISQQNEIKKISSKKLNDSSFFWYLLALARVYLSIAQTGYIHPDEFFQSVQVMAHDILNIEGMKPWEYTDANPVRSVTFSGFVSLPYWILKFLSPYAKNSLGIELLNPNTLVIFPRLFMTFLSFICDYCVFKIASLCYVRPWQCVEVFAGSYIMLVFATRTFSNSVELILFSLLLWRICVSMVDSSKIFRRENVLQDLYESVETIQEKVKIVRFKNKLPTYNYVDSFFISFIVSLGVFIRPTFLLFAFVPLAFWLQRGIVTKEVNFSVFHLRCLSLLPGVLITVISCVLIDSFYYNTLNFSDLMLGNITAASFTVTPINFALYNIQLKNLAVHGLHPYVLHFTVNIPLLHGVLGLVGLYSVSKYLANVVFRRMVAKPKVYSMATMLLCSFIFPVFALSFLPHQEPRYLLPTLVPLVLLHSEKLSIYALPKLVFTKHFLFLFWQIGNILGVLFFGFLHQGGVVRSLQYIHDYVGNHSPNDSYHVFFSHMYSPPTFLLMQKIPVIGHTEEGKKFMIEKGIVAYDLRSSFSPEQIIRKVLEVQSKNTDSGTHFIMCITGSMSKALIEATPKNFVWERIKRFPFHFSSEHLPDFNASDENCNKSCQIETKVKEFCLDIFILKYSEVKNNSNPETQKSNLKKSTENSGKSEL